MNRHCECDNPGFCSRHQMNKSERDYELCKGIADSVDCGKKYWIAWEMGKLGATAPELPILEPENFCSPNLINKAINFTKSLINHGKEGFKKASDEQVNERFIICQSCPLYKASENNKGTCTHSSCGCNIMNEQTFLNKLAWADQKCPIGKWLPISDSITSLEEKNPE